MNSQSKDAVATANDPDGALGTLQKTESWWAGPAVAGLIVFAVFFLISLMKIGSFTQDESEYHYPNLLNFYENGWAAIFNERYAAANTPLPYLLVAILAKVFGPSLFFARLTTLIVSYLTFLVAKRLLTRSGASPFSVFAVVLFPYFFVNSFVFYAVNFGVFFLLAALLVLQRAPFARSANLLAGSLLAAAVLCQQFYLVVPAAVLLHRWWEFQRPPAGQPRLRFADLVASSALLCLPLVVPMALFVAWGGLTHVNFRVHMVKFSPTNITGILFVIGFYFLPCLVQWRDRIRATHALTALAVALALVGWFRPAYSDIQGEGIFTGLVLHLVNIVQTRQAAAAFVLLVALVTSGLLTIWLIHQSLRGSFERMLFVIAMVLTVPYWMNTQIGERHLLGLMVLLFLLVLPKLRPAQAVVYNVYVGGLGIAYFFSWMFVKFGGGDRGAAAPLKCTVLRNTRLTRPPTAGSA